MDDRVHILRWVHASIVQHFFEGLKAAYGEGAFYLRIEGLLDIGWVRGNVTIGVAVTDPDEAVKNVFELRIDGPNMYHVQDMDWYLYMEVNMLISTRIDVNDIYFHQRQTGIVQSLFERAIVISKVGVDPYTDTGDIIACLKLVTDRSARTKLQVSNFGRIAPNTPYQQTTVEGHYAGTCTLRKEEP